MNRNRRVQFMVESDADLDTLESFDVDFSIRELRSGEQLIVSNEPVEEGTAHEIERAISDLSHTTTES